jgi:hypothetical protein
LIRGYFSGDSPFVDANISLPRWRRDMRGVAFLLDTGSHISVLQGDVIAALGIEPSEEFDERHHERSVSIGGTSRFGRTHCFLEFPGHDGPPMRVTVRIPTGRTHAALPPMLGVDFITNFRLTVSRRENHVLLDPRF